MVGTWVLRTVGLFVAPTTSGVLRSSSQSLVTPFPRRAPDLPRQDNGVQDRGSYLGPHTRPRPVRDRLVHYRCRGRPHFRSARRTRRPGTRHEIPGLLSQRTSLTESRRGSAKTSRTVPVRRRRDSFCCASLSRVDGDGWFTVSGRLRKYSLNRLVLFYRSGRKLLSW